jgi:HK97 family phage major capsid protein
MENCPFCGKAITKGVGECPHCKKSLELVNTIGKTVADGIAPLATEVKSVKEGVAGLEGRLKKIESLPLEKFAMPAVIGSSKFLGYNLNQQGRLIKEKTIGNIGFASFNKEENVDGFAKFLLATIHARHPKLANAEAKAFLAEVAKASLAEGSAGTGGDLVPDEYQWDMIQLARSRSYMLQLANVVPMTSDVMILPTEAGLATINWKTEGAGLTQGDPTFSHLTLTAKKATAYAISSNELLQDARVDIVSILTEQFAYGIGLDIDNQALNGTGVPTSGLLCSGVLTTNIVTLAGSMSTINVEKISEAIYKLSEGDLANARFMLCRLGMHYIRSIVDANGNPILQPLAVAMAPSIMGFPYVMSEKISNTDGTGKDFGLFGDFKKYVIGRRVGAMALEVDPYGAFSTDETRFRMINRWAFGVGRETAFVKIITK